MWYYGKMTNKVTLIIPDIHLRWKQAEDIIASVKHDEVIFLGDYFDDFGDTPDMISETCEWLAASVKKPNRIHLFGNHDVHYAFTYRTFCCSGYEQWKYFLIYDSLPRDTWDHVKWYHILDDTWLLTHAGLHKSNLPKDIRALHTDRPKFLQEIANYLDVEIKEGFRKAANNTGSWIFNAGASRGGFNKVGGISWCDYQSEFHPIKGLNQIVGHTPQRDTAKWCVLENDESLTRYPSSFKPSKTLFANVHSSVNLDLDVWKNTHYAIWNGKTMVVKAVNDW